MKPVDGNSLDWLRVEIPAGCGRNSVRALVEAACVALTRADRRTRIEAAIGELADPRAKKKMLAAAITCEIATRALELRASGARDPITRAEKEAAERLGHASGAALNRWLRRNR